jgi:hypothetical protein
MERRNGKSEIGNWRGEWKMGEGDQGKGKWKRENGDDKENRGIE